jgi:hypothetical protein
MVPLFHAPAGRASRQPDVHPAQYVPEIAQPLLVAPRPTAHIIARAQPGVVALPYS